MELSEKARERGIGIIKDLILNNTQPKRTNEDESKDKEDTSALGTLGLKPKPAH